MERVGDRWNDSVRQAASRTRRDKQRRKYSKMDKGTRDKLVRSPGQNGGEDAQKDLHSRTGRDEMKGKTQERMERGRRKRSSSARREKIWRELVTDGTTVSDRPTPTAGCSANGKRRMHICIYTVIKSAFTSNTIYQS